MVHALNILDLFKIMNCMRKFFPFIFVMFMNLTFLISQERSIFNAIIDLVYLQTTTQYSLSVR